MSGIDQGRPGLSLRAAADSDAEALVGLRLRAMEPSLKAAGRWDPERSRSRFLDTFLPEATVIAEQEDAIAGFYMTSRKPECIWLNHLYIEPAYQKLGIGSFFLDEIKKDAAEKTLPVCLEALKGSPANRIYRSQGFEKTGESDFDIQYRWDPS